MRFLFFVCLCLLVNIQAYAANIDPATIVGVWLLDDEEEGIAKDSSKNAFDGVIQGTKQEAGKFGKSLDFAKGDTVTINLGKGTITNKVSVAMWLKFTDLSGQQNYYSIWDQSDHRYVPYKTLANELHFWSNSWDIPSTVFISAKTWYHVVNIYDGTKVSIYVNGELKNSQAAAAFALSDQAQTSWLATDKGGWISACTIDDVGLFNAALSEENVKSIMQNGIARAVGIAAVYPSSKLATLWGGAKIAL